jgi:hypothetical protein
MYLASEPLTCASLKKNRNSRNHSEKRYTMKICRNLFHLITPLACLALAAAQADLAPGRILSLNLDPQSVTTLQLRPGFVTSVRLPEAVSSVVLGDPGAFKAEHSEAEPQLVFFKPSTSSASRTNALIMTRTGHEVSLALVSRGAADRSAPIAHFFFEVTGYVKEDEKGFNRKLLNKKVTFKSKDADSKIRTKYAHLSEDLNFDSPLTDDTKAFQSILDNAYWPNEWRTRSLGSAPLDVTYEIVSFRISGMFQRIENRLKRESPKVSQSHTAGYW